MSESANNKKSYGKRLVLKEGYILDLATGKPVEYTYESGVFTKSSG